MMAKTKLKITASKILLITAGLLAGFIAGFIIGGNI